MNLLRKYLTAIGLVVVITIVSYGQYHDPTWSAKSVLIDKQGLGKDSLKNILHNKGIFEGHFRNFFMTTTNHDTYPDYFALGVGGGLGYYSPIIKGFQVGLSGFIIYNLASSSLSPDPPFSNRYEVGLFDITNPNNHKDLNRLEDLYLRYYFSKKNKSFLQAGKFHLKTPMINLQDGRMGPNLQEGVWAEWNDSKKVKVKGGWIWRTSPRSTIRWFDIGQSLVYPNGRSVNGEKANYSGYTKSEGIAIANLGWKPTKSIDYQIWNYYVDQLFNMVWNKAEYKWKVGERTVMAGIQYAWQKSMYGDTLSLEKQYITQGEQSHTFSARIGLVNDRKGAEWSVNYTRITRHGRYLFPREWGIEPFYTFMQRERNEGAGDVHAANFQHTHFLDKSKNWEVLVAAGMYWMPSTNDARLNKYAMPSYYQLNARSRYRFNGFLRGLNLEVLYVYKGNMDRSIEVQPVYYHNKVDMHNLSVVIDYYF
jgi:hypothetical protein